MILWLLSGCSAPKRELTVPVLAHTLESCPLPGPANLSLSALGDFAISNLTAEYLSLDAVGTKLTFPANTLALSATASADVSSQPFIAYSERGDQRFDLLLWPDRVSCELFRPNTADSYPGKLGGEALGYSESTGLVLLAGSNDATSAAIVGALTFDSRSGDRHVVNPRERAVLTQPRAFATVTDFAGAVLVAGGENPIHDATEPASTLRDTAEIYDPETQSFDPALISLAGAVSHHAAITLKTGETALFGGRSEAAWAGALVQVVSPVTRIAKVIQPLAEGRYSPTAIRLDDDRILVAGGTDDDDHPVAAIEWRDLDASALPAPFDGSVALAPRFNRAFVALPGGAALAVGGCADRAPRTGEDCSAWCARGCPPLLDDGVTPGYDAYWLDPDGSVESLIFPWVAPAPVLIPGSDGRPWLVAAATDDAGNALPHRFALYRFDPWSQGFDPVDFDLDFDDTLNSTRLVATGPDAFVWLDADASGSVLRGARLGTRSAFVSDVALVSSSEDFARPSHLAPDHVPGTQVRYDPASAALSFSQAEPDSQPTCVWIADAKYGDFSATISFSSALPPALRVGATPISAGSPCAPPAAPAGTTALTLHRVASQLTLVSAGSTTTCALDDGDARVSFAACQTTLGPTTLTGVELTRGD